MAFTVCFRCDQFYSERNESCPHCGCLKHGIVVAKEVIAVKYLCKDVEADPPHPSQAPQLSPSLSPGQMQVSRVYWNIVLTIFVIVVALLFFLWIKW
jgi:hypothetical protein